jgi:indolepyruvate ferredoxin oxidoreductase
MPIDPRFLAESGREVFTGNELLVKGCLEVEGGIHLMTGYPGSPVAGFFDCMGDIKDLLSRRESAPSRPITKPWRPPH